MPVVADPQVPDPDPDGLIFAVPTPAASVVVPFTDCGWWLVIPEAPDLSIHLELVQPSAGSGTLPSGNVAWSAKRDVAEGVHHAFGRSRAIVTHGVMQGEELDISIVFRGEAALDAFNEARDSFLTGLLQSDQVGRQWYVDLGTSAPRAVPQLHDRQTNPLYVVSLHPIEVDAP